MWKGYLHVKHPTCFGIRFLGFSKHGSQIVTHQQIVSNLSHVMTSISEHMWAKEQHHASSMSRTSVPYFTTRQKLIGDDTARETRFANEIAAFQLILLSILESHGLSK
jgi:hypothetical protein